MSSDEVLQDQLRVLEVAGVVVICLSVHAFKRFLQVSSPVDVLLHVVVFEQVAVLLDQFLRSDVTVLVKQSDPLQSCRVVSCETRRT